MNRLNASLLLFLATLCYRDAVGQAQRPFIQFAKPFSPVPANRWEVSFNPLSIFELPRALGVGIGYRLGSNMQLSSETCLVWGWIPGPVWVHPGFRQVFQFKRFLDPHYFLAAEVRYKRFSYQDTSDFYNAATHQTLTDQHFLSLHHFFGAALQGGYRAAIYKEGRLVMEITAGLGFKNKVIDRNKGIPAGYQYRPVGKNIDVNIRGLIEQDGGTIYLPGSLRLIYTFGKKM